ncbi:hypothetical protein [Streptomyces sp. NPDC002758]
MAHPAHFVSVRPEKIQWTSPRSAVAIRAHETLSAFARKPDAALRLTQEALADPAVPPFIAGQETTPT